MIANIKLYEELSEVLGKEKAKSFIEALIVEIKDIVKQEKPETIKEIKKEIKEELATKQDMMLIREDIKNLEIEIEKSKSETIKWVAGLLIAQSAFIIALLKLL